MREIEIKIKADNLEDLIKRLDQQGCVLSAPINQHDTIYSYGESNVEWEDSKEGHVVVRIRRENDKAEFNLKQQKTTELDNLEYETEIKNPEAMHSILLIMGYRPKVEVKKIRRRGKINGYEICLDEVERLGFFVELEKLASDDVDPEEIREDLFRELQILGLKRENQEKRGYDTQIYALDHK